jgi:hypothetical protein
VLLEEFSAVELRDSLAAGAAVFHRMDASFSCSPCRDELSKQRHERNWFYFVFSCVGIFELYPPGPQAVS